MALLNFLKPKNQLEEGGRSQAPIQRDAEEPEKKCPNCHKEIPLSRLWGNQLVCSCGYHFRMKARQRIQMLVDKDSFKELFSELQADNPLRFPGYKEKIETVRTGKYWRTKMLPVCHGTVFHDGKYGKCRGRKDYPIV